MHLRVLKSKLTLTEEWKIVLKMKNLTEKKPSLTKMSWQIPKELSQRQNPCRMMMMIKKYFNCKIQVKREKENRDLAQKIPKIIPRYIKDFLI